MQVAEEGLVGQQMAFAGSLAELYFETTSKTKTFYFATFSTTF